MLKQQHYTQIKVRKVKSKSITPLSKQDNVQSIGHYRKINPLVMIQDYNFAIIKD